MDSISSRVSIDPVSGRGDLRRFLDFPKDLYRSDRQWITPLDQDLTQWLKPSHPFREHGEMALWLARRNGQVCGRISAQIDRRHAELHGERVGYFGFFDCANEPDTAAALLAAAAEWLAARGQDLIRGPFNPTINASCGVLIDGRDSPPYMMMPHTPAYLPDLLTGVGLEPVQELLAYRLELVDGPPAHTSRLIRRYGDRLHHRHITPRTWRRDLEQMRLIFNDAWSGNWGFIPFSEREFSHLGSEIRPLIDPRQGQIIDVDGEPAAMMITLPNLNDVLRDLDGRLLPFGWLRLLMRIKLNRIKSARVVLLGVKRQWQKTPLASVMAYALLTRSWQLGCATGWTEAELSWVLRDNRAIRLIIEKIGGVVYKRYAVYQRPLGTEPGGGGA